MIYINLIAYAYIIANIIPKPKLLNRKPFTCVFCLSFWGSIAIDVYRQEFTGVYPLVAISGSLFEMAYQKLMSCLLKH